MKSKKIPDSDIVTSVALSYKVPQVNALICETYKVQKDNKSKVHKIQKPTQSHVNSSFFYLTITNFVLNVETSERMGSSSCETPNVSI